MMRKLVATAIITGGLIAGGSGIVSAHGDEAPTAASPDIPSRNDALWQGSAAPDVARGRPVGFVMPTYAEYVKSETARNALRVESETANAFGSGRSARLVHSHDYLCDPVGGLDTVCTDGTTGFGPLYWVFVGGGTEWGGPVVGYCINGGASSIADSNTGWRTRYYYSATMSLYGLGSNHETLLTSPTPCDANTACAYEFNTTEYGYMAYVSNSNGVVRGDCVH